MAISKVSDMKTWEIDVVNSPIPVFVDFWAEWCGPCRMVGPVVEELADDYDGKIKFVKVNVDDANALASKYNVFSIPTLMIFNKGEIVAQQVGAASKDSYKNMIAIAKRQKFPFPYLADPSQEVARAYDAVCTPDFFGYNKNLELQYRGRIRELKDLKPVEDNDSDLYKAMKQIAETGNGPKDQIPSMGCNIKWFNN